MSLVLVVPCHADDPERMTVVRDSINATIPQAHQLRQKWQSIQIASRTLETLQPNATCTLAAAALERELARFIEERANAAEKPPRVTAAVSETSVDLQRQWIDVAAKLDLEMQEPPVKLRVRLGGGAAPALLGQTLRMFVALTTVHVESVSAPDAAMLDAMLPAVNASLRPAIEQVNASLDRQPFDIALDLAPIGPIDLQQQIAAAGGLSDVTAAPITLTYSLRGAAVFLDHGGVNVLAEVSFADVSERMTVPEPVPPPELTEEGVAADYGLLKDRFAQLRAAFAGTPPENAVAWAAVSRALTAEAVNAALASPRFCGTYDLAATTAPYNLRIDTFQNGEIDCSPRMACDLVPDTRDCRRPKACERRHDTRSCGRWWGNDPICEAAKAAQNIAYEAEFAACQLTPQFIVDVQCEADKAAANVARKLNHDLCEIDKARLKGQCELYKELVKQAQQVANVSGSLGFDGAARLCIEKIQTTADLSSVTISGSAGANAIAVGGSMRYIPLNIPGHLGCPGEWTRELSASVHVPAQSFVVTMPLLLEQEAERASLSYELGSQTIAAEMKPPPFEAVFARHPDLVVVCPGPAAVLGTASLLNAAYFATRGEDLVPELRGRLTLTTRALRQSIALEPKVTAIGSTAVRLMPRVGERAIEFVAYGE